MTREQLDQMAAEALQRLRAHINRQAGQHKRALAKQAQALREGAEK